jgi:DUF1365 family protein
MSLGTATTVAGNGPPPDAALSLCDGAVMHARFRPKPHRFDYRIVSLLIDIDRLDEAGRTSPLFSVDRFNLYAFRRADHGPADGSDLRAWIERELARAGLAEPPARILLHCGPRVLGFGFDPISVWFCYDAGDTLTALVYQVRNTFGDRHSYVAPVAPGETGPEGIRQERAKLFHVSPFMDLAMRYRFRILPPGRGLRIRILEVDRDGPMFAASHVARLQPLTSAGIARSFLRVPWVSLKVVGAIHYEALRLWLKGMPFFGRPEPPHPVSHRDGVALRKTQGNEETGAAPIAGPAGS